MSLDKYHEKRNFNSTNEPKGKVGKQSKSKTNKSKTSQSKTKPYRFVIQYHQARAKHYDFRLEWKGVLLSWAVPKGLSMNPKDKRLAVHVEDHPTQYADFEGVIPKGNYGAGSVEIFDKGNYLPLEDMDKGLKKGHIKVLLNGTKLKGAWSLVRLEDDNWLIIKSDDEFVETKSSQKKTNKNPFSNISPQLATLSNKIPQGKDWLFEIKYDGYRILSYFEQGKIKMLSRNQNDYTQKFNNIAKSLTKLNQDSFVVDGEVVVFDENGKTDFGMLQNSIKTQAFPMHYVIFDLLALNGEDLRDLPLFKRKEKLERLLAKADDNLILSSFVINKGEESFSLAKQNNLEGIVAKNINSPYTSKRTDDWLKIKCYLRQEFVLCGYTTSSKNELISAILLGYYHDDELIYVGKVGTGLDQAQKEELYKKFKKLISKSCPFKKAKKEKNVVWLQPKLVAEIQFAELTSEKLLRQPSFIALRTDKAPKEVKLEIIDEH